MTKSNSPNVVSEVEEVKNKDWEAYRERMRKTDEKIMCNYKAATVIFWDWEAGKVARYENARLFGEVHFQEGYKKACDAGELHRVQASEWQRDSLREMRHIDTAAWALEPCIQAVEEEIAMLKKKREGKAEREDCCRTLCKGWVWGII